MESFNNLSPDQVEKIRKESLDQVRGLHANYRDKTDEELIRATADLIANTKIEAQAGTTRDPLTGLLNKAGFAVAFKTAQDNLRREPLLKPISFLMIDGDNFKIVNDKYGHQRGDQLLIYMALAIMMGVRRADVVARYGGDEFIIALPGADTNGALMVAERIQNAYRNFQSDQFTHSEVGHLRDKEGHSLPVQIFSIGIATGSANDTQNQLTDRADKAMYAAKEASRQTGGSVGKVAVFESNEFSRVI